MTDTAPVQRREEVLAAALEVFDAKGYHRATVDDVGAAAGITGPTVYRHFPSKESLLRAAVDRADALLGRAAARVDDPHDLPALVRAYMDEAADHARLLRVVQAEARSLPPDVWVAMSAQRQAARAPWRQAVQVANPSWSAAQADAAVRSAVGVLVEGRRRPPDAEDAIAEQWTADAVLAVLTAGAQNAK